VGGAARVWQGVLGGPAELLEALSALVLCCCTAWLLFEEGYPLRPGWGGGLDGGQKGAWGAPSEGRRLLAAENALAHRERLVASGVLALGAAHEFKNALSHMRVTAQHALSTQSPGGKDDGLRLLLQQADTGAGPAIDLLEKIAAVGRQEPAIIDGSRDLAGFMAMLRASFRGEGIVVQADFGSVPAFKARRAEVEQILLNVVRNAVECFRVRTPHGRKTITIRGLRSGEWALLTVEDNAGGVPAAMVDGLFSIASSGNGSTGLGLYLSRSLAVSNDGTLDYQGTDGGSIFTLAFPVAEEEGE
jgi:nitrogen-specific signal transduction histidine kinase